jgi:glutamate--cysteine ligase catalytic subunit
VSTHHCNSEPILSFPEEAKNGAALPNHIYMDAMGFGMGCSCLQMTFQACSVKEALRVYDALVPMGPIMVSQLVMR